MSQRIWTPDVGGNFPAQSELGTQTITTDSGTDPITKLDTT